METRIQYVSLSRLCYSYKAGAKVKDLSIRSKLLMLLFVSFSAVLLHLPYYHSFSYKSFL